jgi:tetratricopeptide (TPR) repeat protein
MRMKFIGFTMIVFTVVALPIRARQKPLDKARVLALLSIEGDSDSQTQRCIRTRGINFEPGQDFEALLRKAGAEENLLSTLRGARRVDEDKSVQVNDEVLQRIASGAALWQEAARGGPSVGQAGYDRARGEFQAAISAAPENASVHYAFGKMLAHIPRLEGNSPLFQEASAELRTAIRLDPQFVEPHLELASLLPETDLDGRIEECQEALRIDPENEGAHADFIMALSMKYQGKEAVENVRQAIRDNPTNAQFHFDAAFLLDQSGDLDGALREYREVLRLNPNHPEAHFKLAQALQRGKHDLDGAIAEYREAVRTSDGDFERGLSYYNLAFALLEKGDLQSAGGAYQDAVRCLGPERLQGFVERLIPALEGSGKLAAALKQCHEATRLYPRDATLKAECASVEQRATH